jgi:tagatose-6-phosphate ketose/aldose isomerase
MAKILANPLQQLLELSEQEKEAKGARYTAAEIFHQPETWKATFELCERRKPELKAFLRKAGVGEQGSCILLVGAGSSDYIGRTLAHLLRRCWQSDVEAVASTDLLLELDQNLLPQRNYLLVSFSRSGDSPEGVAVLQQALERYPRTSHLVITCNAQAAMSRVCDEYPDRAFALVLDDAVNDRGLAMTSSFTNMVVAGQYLAHIDDPEGYRRSVEVMANAGKSLLFEFPETAFGIAERQLTRACFIGSGALAGVAYESALKLLELTGGKIITMAQSTLGLRHGPLTAIDRNTLFVQFLSLNPKWRSYELDLLEEVGRKKLAGMRLVVDSSQDKRASSLADHVIRLNLPADFPDDCRPPVDVITGQLLGLFASLRAGLRPDNPSPSGTISRVVAGIKIYP